jgi:hypothetical protein
MADEAVLGESTGQGESESETEKTLAGFHKAMNKRTAERDAALNENAALKAQIAELQAYAAEVEEDETEDDESYDPPTPRGQNASRRDSYRLQPQPEEDLEFDGGGWPL